MTQAALPVEAIEKDHRLEGQATKASEALAKHRWHWTLDESNPQRVSMRAYARAVGRGSTTIQSQVNGYADWLMSGPDRSLAEAIARAAMSTDKAELVEAVADANKISFKQAREHYSTDVTRLREAVERKVEKEPDFPPEERAEYARKVANTMARSRKVEGDRRQNRKQHSVLAMANIDASLMKAKRSLVDAVNEARGARLDPDLIPRLEQAIDQIKSLAEWVRMALLGTVDVDWDEEFRKLEVL